MSKAEVTNDCPWIASCEQMCSVCRLCILKNWNCFPTFISQNISYKMYGSSNIVMTVYLERFIVEVDEESYNYTFEQSLVNICGLSAETAATIADSWNSN